MCLIRLAALDVDLAAAQLVVVAALAAVVLAVRLLTCVDLLQGRSRVAVPQGLLHQEQIPGIAVRFLRVRRPADQRPGKAALRSCAFSFWAVW